MISCKKMRWNAGNGSQYDRAQALSEYNILNKVWPLSKVICFTVVYQVLAYNNVPFGYSLSKIVLKQLFALGTVNIGE